MLPWPFTTPAPGALTVPATAPLPPSYWQAVAAGNWPKRYWLPTTEPTSSGLDGVAIHALATPGPATTVTELPAGLTPIAVDEQQVFAVAADGRIRYLDLEVDQWLTVAKNWDDFAAQLTWRPPVLEPPYSQQALVHALLVSDAASLPALLEALRAQEDWPQYVAWLTYLAQGDRRAVAKDEAAFAQQFLPLSATQQQMLTGVFG